MFEAGTDALVNTVNCEGFMGKGIAYQFKTRFPKNNDNYVVACKNGEFGIGKVLVTEEKEKVIINLPTKDKWRKKSTYEFIDSGMLALVNELPKLNIKSIAVPPLGCGNGGLDWNIVKDIIVGYLLNFSDELDIIIFEPSSVVNKSKVARVPKLNASHLILMKIKTRLNKFNKVRLQKSGFFLNYFSQEKYFKFENYHFGPYSNAISILSRQIGEYQSYYNIKTDKALELALNTNISRSVMNKLEKFENSIVRATNLINKISEDKELELLATVLTLIEQNYPCSNEQILGLLRNWSEHKRTTFSRNNIDEAVDILVDLGLITMSLGGYTPTLIKEVTAK